MIALHTSIIRLVFGWVVSGIITEGPLRTLPEQKNSDSIVVPYSQSLPYVPCHGESTGSDLEEDISHVPPGAVSCCFPHPAQENCALREQLQVFCDI